MPAGRPLKFKDAKELEKKVSEYFVWADVNNKPYTIARLALFLDVDRQTIYNYAEHQEFFDIIKRARDKIIASLEETLYIEGKPGQIFIAKNYGYTDKQEVESKNVNYNKNEDVTLLSAAERKAELEKTNKEIEELEKKMKSNKTE